jgi:carbon monoxide dehydrogenase subunit G
MLKKILLGLAALIVVFAVVVALQSPHFHIERTASISAPPATVFALVNDFHRWDAWSPWAKLDPAMKTTFEGPAIGTGSIYSWAGNEKVGEGRMTLTESRPNESIKIKLEFIKPFASVCDTAFTFKPQGGQTGVTWAMDGEKNYIAKAFCLFMSMDRTVGGDFERGLAKMKSVAESGKAP